MSEVTAIATETAAPTTRKRQPRTEVPFSSIHVTFAKSKGIDVTRAAKLNRSFIRSNFDSLVRVWPALKQAHKVNRDGNRYPPTIPANVANIIVKRDASALVAAAKRKKS